LRGLRQRNAIVWRRSVDAIGFASRRPLSGIDHLPDQPVFIVQELHHFQRGWGGPNPRRFCRVHPLAAYEQQAPNTGQHRGSQQPSHYGSIPRHGKSSAVSNDRSKFKRMFETDASRKEGVFEDLISWVEVLALQAAEC
jgi:hypothetical protein